MANKINIKPTLEIIMFTLQYFKNPVKGNINNVKARMKLFVNDVYGYLQQNEDYIVGISQGVRENIDGYRKVTNRNVSMKTLKSAFKWTYEHGIPWDVSFPILVSKDFKDTDELLQFFRDTYAQCYVTQAEDVKLKNAGFNKSMPKGWTMADSWTKRYEDAGITVYKIPGKK